MTTVESSELTERTDHPEIGATTRDRPWGIIVAVVAVVCLVVGGVAGWFARGGDEGAAEMPDEVEQLLDEYVRTWEEQDYETFRTLVTDDFLIRTEFHNALGEGFFVEGPWEEGAGSAVAGIFARANDIEWQSDAAVVGDGPWFVYVVDSWIGDFTRDDGVSAFTIVDRDGRLMVAGHTFVGTTSQVD